MVLEIDRVPGKLILPKGESGDESFPGEPFLEPLHNYLVRLHMAEGEHHIQLLPFGKSKLSGILYIHKYCLTYSKAIIFLHYRIEALQDFVGAWKGQIVLASCKNQPFSSILQTVLIQDVYYIAPESLYTLIQPEPEDLLDLFP